MKISNESIAVVFTMEEFAATRQTDTQLIRSLVIHDKLETGMVETIAGGTVKTPSIGINELPIAKGATSQISVKKFTALVVVSTILLLATTGLVNNHFKTTAELTTENSLLKEQVKNLSTRLGSISHSLKQLAFSDSQLRAEVNLSKVDIETRAMETDGAQAAVFNGLIAKDVGEMLKASSVLMDKIEREVVFQRQSYEQIYHKQEENKKLFASIPAIKPMAGTYSYHGFGMRRDPFLGIMRMHGGVDIHNDAGTAVYATGDGVVEYSGETGSSYGTALAINHGYGYQTWYAHLSICVAYTGEQVRRGQLIAYSGNTGRSTGPHLHYEVRKDGKQQNPVEYFVDDVDYEKIKTQLASGFDK